MCAVRPSVLGAGLLDVTFDAPLAEPLPTGAREIWELWRAGRPGEPGLWARYDRDLRHQWSGAALAHHHAAPDRVAGATFHLDGRGVTDVEGFFCAIGEAVNGPGGYFGSNLDALHDCVTGGWGATRPSRLVWHDAHIAKARLGTVFDDLIHMLTADGVEVVPR